MLLTRLCINLDFVTHHLLTPEQGTKTLRVGVQIIPKESRPLPNRTHILQLQKGRASAEIPQIVGFYRESPDRDFEEEDFVWGFDLTSMLNDHHESAAEECFRVFERLKMELYPMQRTEQARSAIQETLQATDPNLTSEGLIERHLRCIRKAAMTATVRAYRSTSWSAEEIERMEVHTFFTVPEISNWKTTNTMQQLLTSAGFGKTVALTETGTCLPASCRA